MKLPKILQNQRERISLKGEGRNRELIIHVENHNQFSSETAGNRRGRRTILEMLKELSQPWWPT